MRIVGTASGRQRLREELPPPHLRWSCTVPRFFIDTSDERAFVTDDIGLEFDNVQAARDAAVAALPEMARDASPSGDHGDFFATVRDQHDRVLLKASLTLSVVWSA